MRRSNETGFTLLELCIVVLLAGVLLVAMHSSGDGGKEAQVGTRGELDLINIYNSEKRNHIDKGVYFYSPTTAGINSGLGLSLQGTYFSYKVVSVVSSADGFLATATRTSGRCTNAAMSLSATGVKTKNGCSAW